GSPSISAESCAASSAYCRFFSALTLERLERVRCQGQLSAGGFRGAMQSRNVAAVFRRQNPNVPLNPQLDTLSDYPFEALRTLLNPVSPVVNDAPILMSLGEPQHQPPPLLAETLAANALEWNKYPPMAGTPELRQAIADWLGRRYRLAAGSIDPDRHVMPLAGTKEGLYLF